MDAPKYAPELRHNDKMIADKIKTGIDALSVLAQYRLDFIEDKGLLQEYFKYLAKKKAEIRQRKIEDM